MDEAGLMHWPKKAGGMPRGKRFLEDSLGVPLQDVWTDIRPIHNMAAERLGYPTQKPIALLDRIIQSSANKGDVIFDAFCGCGTTIYSAVRNDRNWIGCDVAILAVKLIREILTGDEFRLVEGTHFDVEGIPVSVECFSKQTHSNSSIGLSSASAAFPPIKTGDKGIDGRMYFETKEGLNCMVLSVKGGGIRPTDLRDLRGVLAREQDMAMAGFLSLKPPSKAMWEEAATAGQFHTPTKMVSRISTKDRWRSRVVQFDR